MMNAKDRQENSKRRIALVNLVYEISDFWYSGKVPFPQDT